MSNPIISVLVPVYNVAPYIERCVRSLFEQTYPNLEYVFVNDATPDDSMEILERVMEDYPQRKAQVKIVNHVSNRGLAAVRNTCVTHAMGEYVTFVDSDDYLCIDAIKCLYERMVETQADLVMGNRVTVQEGFPAFISHFPRGCAFTQKDKFNILDTVVYAKLYHISLFEHIHWIEGLNLGEDVYTVPILFYYAKQIAVTEHTVYYYVKNASSYTGSRTSLNYHAVEFYKGLQYLSEQFEALPNAEDYLIWIDDVVLSRKVNDFKRAFPNYRLIKEISCVFPKAYQSIKRQNLKSCIFLSLASAKCYGLLYVVTGAQRFLVWCRKMLRG